MRVCLDDTEKKVSFAYFSPENNASKGLFALLETAPTIAAAVVFGNSGLPWKVDGKRFTHLWHRGEIGDTELRTEEEARAQADEMGLSLNDAKALLRSNYKDGFGVPPVIVEPQVSLAERAAKFRK